MFTTRVGRLVLLFSVMILFTACCKSKGPSTIKVSVDSALDDRAVSVDLAGVNFTNKAQWDDMDLHEYWQPRDEFRTSASRQMMIHEKEFAPGSQPRSFEVGRASSSWKTWDQSGVKWVYVYVDLPKGPRRGEVPIDPDECEAMWNDVPKVINVTITEEAVFVNPDLD